MASGWPGEGHPDAMKMSCRQGYFHTRLRLSAKFAGTEFSEVHQCFIADPPPTGNKAGMSRENAEGGVRS